MHVQAPKSAAAVGWGSRQGRPRLLHGAFTVLLLSPLTGAAAETVAIPAAAQGLIHTLKAHGFRVVLAPPPTQGAYGLFQSKTKTIWVHPLSFELGIGLQTLVHEAVHAAQSCPSGTLTPVGWRLPLSTVVKQEIQGLLFRHYQGGSRHLEQEAFAMQGQPNALKAVAQAIQQRCGRKPKSSGR